MSSRRQTQGCPSGVTPLHDDPLLDDKGYWFVCDDLRLCQWGLEVRCMYRKVCSRLFYAMHFSVGHLMVVRDLFLPDAV